MVALPLHSTNLYTNPNAGYFWQVTKFVPIPNTSISWPYYMNLSNDYSFMSLDATTIH